MVQVQEVVVKLVNRTDDVVSVKYSHRGRERIVVLNPGESTSFTVPAGTKFTVLTENVAFENGSREAVLRENQTLNIVKLQSLFT